MAVKTKDDYVKLTKLIFQARYRDGIVIIDRLGTLASAIQKRDREYVLATLNPAGALMFRKAKKRFISNIGTDYLDLQFTQSTIIKESKPIVEDLAQDAEWLYEETMSVLGVPETTRLGIYFEFLAPADSLEESDRFAVKVLKSPFFEWANGLSKSEPTDAQASYVFRDSETGISTSVTILSMVTDQPPGSLPPMGFSSVEGSGGLGIGIDNFSKPGDVPFAKTRSFINTQYETAQKIALELFHKVVCY